MTEKIQKYQIIKFDSFDFLIILILNKNFYRPTDRQTDRPTDRQTDIWPYRSDLPSLKKGNLENMSEVWNVRKNGI